MKILNLYAGIGGNRKLWGNEHKITAVELDERIASIYADIYSDDTVIVGDAHEYLLEHYQEFDFIWASPPCPTHSIVNFFLNAKGIIRYPDMKLYQEIILLQHFFKGDYVIENVKSYYDPLIIPQVSGRHYFWSNFKIPHLESRIKIGRMCGDKDTLGVTQGEIRKKEMDKFGFDLSKYQYPEKDKLLRNCVDPEIGLAILRRATESYKQKSAQQQVLF
jgi:DNA (cytosine-5)-methyltransferase 1